MTKLQCPMPKVAELTGPERMTLLCESFPTLADVPGACPWDQERFAKWASGPAPSTAMRQAAAFVLSVWNGGTPADSSVWFNEAPFHVGVFDPVLAFGLWDQRHADAYIAWCRRPFWP